MTSNIVLIGFMGCGKTTVGRVIAKKIGYMFIDTDAMVERASGRAIPEIFAIDGEDEFRRLETEAVLKAAGSKCAVIAAGGGVPLRIENMAALRAGGVLVYMRVPPDRILRNTARDSSRPLLNRPNKKEAVLKMIESRRPYYEAADIALDLSGCTINKAADKIIAAIKEHLEVVK
jgi:shikimate kinase